MATLTISGNYLVIDTGVGEPVHFATARTSFRNDGIQFIIKDHNNDGILNIPIADVGTYGYTEASLTTLLETSTGLPSGAELSAET